MRISLSLLTVALLVASASVAGAQNPVTKAADAVSSASKTVGRDAKADVKVVGSKTHHVLKTTGRSIKASVKKADSDDKPKTWKQRHHKPGGLNKAARDVSEDLKHVGRSAKADIHGAADSTHKALKKTGNAIKHPQ